jgi:hypothetical protein
MRNENIFFKNKTEIGNTNVPIEQFATGNRITPTASATSVKEGTIAFSELGDLCYTKKDKNGVGRWFSLGLKNLNFNELKILTLNQKWTGTKGSYNGDVNIMLGSSGKINIAPISLNFAINREKTLGGYVISASVVDYNTDDNLTPPLFFVASQYSLNLWCDEVEELLNNEIEVIWRYQSKDIQFAEEKYRNLIASYLRADLYKVQSLFEAIDKELPKKLGNTSFTPTPRTYKGFNDFKNVKIIVDTPEKSKKFQELIFSLGGSWAQNFTTYVQETDSKYIYSNGSVLLTSGSNEDFYKNNNNEEIFYDDVFPNESSTSSSTSSTTTDFNGYTAEEFIDEMFSLNPFNSKIIKKEDLYDALFSKRLSYKQKFIISSCFGTFESYSEDKPNWDLFKKAQMNFRTTPIPDSTVKFNKFKIKPVFFELIKKSPVVAIWNGTTETFNNDIIYDSFFSKAVKNNNTRDILFEAYEEYYNNLVSGTNPSTPTQTQTPTTKKYTAEDFKNTKIIVDTPEKSTNLQNFLFSLGLTWATGSTSVLYTSKQYIDINTNKKITATNNETTFENLQNKEIFYDDFFPDTNPTATSSPSKKYTLDDFKRKKIIVDTPEKSKKIQELFFSIGGKYIGEYGVQWTTPQNLDKPYLVMDVEGQMTYMNGNFANSDWDEIFYKDIFPDTNTTATPTKKTWTLDDFYGTKFRVRGDFYNQVSEEKGEERSKKFQELVFSLGVQWADETQKVKFTDKPYLYINYEGELDYGTYGADFLDSDYREIFYDDIFPKTNSIADMDFSSLFENALKSPTVTLNSVNPTKTLEELEQEYSDLLFLISVTPTINFKEVSELKQQASVLKDEIDASVLIIKDKLLTENNIFDELFTASSVQTKHRYDIKPYADGFAPNGTPTMLPKSIYELTLTDNFESWFGNFQSAYQFKNSPYTEVPCSIVKNIHYEPQIVYHGTGAQFSFFDFNNFPIMYFAENYYYAEWFAEQKGAENGTNGYVYPFFLDIKNPLDLTHFGIDEITPQEFVDWLYLQTGLEADELKINPAILQSKKPTWAWVYLRNGEEMLKVLRDTKLFDGIVYYEQNPPIKPTERNYKTKGFIIFASQSAKIVDPERYNLLLPSMRSFYLKKGGKL